MRRKEAADGSFILVYLGDGATGYQLELTWLRDWEKESYNLGDNEFHLAFETDDMDASLKKHRGDGLRLLRESIYGNLFYLGSGWILAGDSTGKIR